MPLRSEWGDDMIVAALMSRVTEYYLNKYFKWLVSREFDENTYAVYEVLECKAKAKFMRAMPHMIVSTLVNPSSLIGLLLHEGLNEILRQENRTRVFTKSVNVNNTAFRINGWPDYYDGGKVIEIKFTTRPISEPEQRHVQQTRMYMWLTDVMEGYLIYITPRRVVEFKIESPMTDDEVVKVIKEWSSPRYDNECTTCPFRTICSLAKVEQPKRAESET